MEWTSLSAASESAVMANELSHQGQEASTMENTSMIGVDLGKSSFQLTACARTDRLHSGKKCRGNQDFSASPTLCGLPAGTETSCGWKPRRSSETGPCRRPSIWPPERRPGQLLGSSDRRKHSGGRRHPPAPFRETVCARRTSVQLIVADAAVQALAPEPLLILRRARRIRPHTAAGVAVGGGASSFMRPGVLDDQAAG